MLAIRRSRPRFSRCLSIEAAAGSGAGDGRGIDVDRALKSLGGELDRAGSYCRLIRWCGEAQALCDGRKIHDHIASSEFRGDRRLENRLIGMYGKCGSLDEARRIFDGIAVEERNFFTWSEMVVACVLNGDYGGAVEFFQRMAAEGFVPDKCLATVMISAHLNSGHPLEALILYWRMHVEGVRPDTYVVGLALKACTQVGSLQSGRAIHASIASTPYEDHLIVANCLVTMYGKCGSSTDAKTVFDGMQLRDVVSWNALIVSYSQVGDSAMAIRVLREMHHDGTKPDAFTFVGVLDSCSELDQGRRVHAQATEVCFDRDREVGLGNAILSMYGRCCSVADARDVFDGIVSKNSVSWAAMLTAYTQLGHPKEALDLARFMRQEGVRSNRASLLGLLAACATLEDLDQGRHLHGIFLSSGLTMDVFVETTLVNMYGKCGSLDSARAVLEGMKVKSVVSWNAMIKAYAQRGRGGDALGLLKMMDLEGTMPSKVTFVSILDACASSGDLIGGRMLHSRATAVGFGGDINVNNTLISMYGKCTSLAEARKVFDAMPCRDIVSWNALAVEYSRHGFGEDALKLLRKMDLEGLKLDKISYAALLNACVELGHGMAAAMHGRVLASGFQIDGNIVANFLINLYARCGSLVNAKTVFDRLTKRDVVSWNAMMTVYVQLELYKDALKLFRTMDLEGIRPDEVTYVLGLDACAGAVASIHGKLLHSRVTSQGLDRDDVVRNAVVNMYAECGNLAAAGDEFDKIRHRDVVSWTVMVAANAQHGSPRDSLKIFWRMQQEGTKPDEISFLCAILSCSRSGFVKDAMLCFRSMTEDHRIEPLPDHYACLVDALAKAGRLVEAEELARRRRLPAMADSDPVSWRSLLSACRDHGDARRGVNAASLVNAADPNSYVLLANLLTSQSTLESIT